MRRSQLLHSLSVTKSGIPFYLMTANLDVINGGGIYKDVNEHGILFISYLNFDLTNNDV